MSSPRLADIDPDALGLEVAELVLAHLARYALPLSPGVTLHIEGDGASSNIALTVADLTRYAQSGDTADWGDDSGALDAIQEVASILYSRAGEPGTFGLGDLEAEIDPKTGIGAVLIAAMARLALLGGKPVDARALAVLSGVAREHVYRLIRDGEIAARGEARSTEIAGAEARRWLSGRGILIAKKGRSPKG